MTKLRRVTTADIEFIERQYSDPAEAGDHAWYGYRNGGRLRQAVIDDTVFTDGHGILAIANDDGSIVGEVSWRTTAHGPQPGGSCFNMGIWIAPEHRGEGHGTTAQRLAAAYLFDHTLTERVEAGTETDNMGEQRALERAGFTREGVLRHGAFRAGQWRDMVLYSKLRGEA